MVYALGGKKMGGGKGISEEENVPPEGKHVKMLCKKENTSTSAPCVVMSRRSFLSALIPFHHLSIKYVEILHNMAQTSS